MAYKIVYDSGAQKYEVYKKHTSHLSTYTAVAFAVFLVCTCLFWPEGKQELQNLLIPGNDGATIQAAENMKENLLNGVDLRTAVSAFCREIIHGA